MPSFPPQNETQIHLPNIEAVPKDLQSGVEGSSHFYLYVTLFIIGLIVVLFMLLLIIKWILREKRLRELRHRLIPLYTFDPNDEDDWEAELLSQDQSIFPQRPPQDYNSVSVKEDNESSINKRKLNLV